VHVFSGLKVKAPEATWVTAMSRLSAVKQGQFSLNSGANIPVLLVTSSVTVAVGLRVG